MILEILCNRRLTDAGASIHSKPGEVLLRELYDKIDISLKMGWLDIDFIIDGGLNIAN